MGLIPQHAGLSEIHRRGLTASDSPKALHQGALDHVSLHDLDPRKRNSGPAGQPVSSRGCNKTTVEVDGAYHVERARADAARDAVLKRAGYRVLRFQAQLVVREIETVVARVRTEL